jgi:hypothetical protein
MFYRKVVRSAVLLVASLVALVGATSVAEARNVWLNGVKLE